MTHDQGTITGGSEVSTFRWCSTKSGPTRTHPGPHKEIHDIKGDPGPHKKTCDLTRRSVTSQGDPGPHKKICVTSQGDPGPHKTIQDPTILSHLDHELLSILQYTRACSSPPGYLPFESGTHSSPWEWAWQSTFGQGYGWVGSFEAASGPA